MWKIELIAPIILILIPVAIVFVRMIRGFQATWRRMGRPIGITIAFLIVFLFGIWYLFSSDIDANYIAIIAWGIMPLLFLLVWGSMKIMANPGGYTVTCSGSKLIFKFLLSIKEISILDLKHIGLKSGKVEFGFKDGKRLYVDVRRFPELSRAFRRVKEINPGVIIEGL